MMEHRTRTITYECVRSKFQPTINVWHCTDLVYPYYNTAQLFHELSCHAKDYPIGTTLTVTIEIQTPGSLIDHAATLTADEAAHAEGLAGMDDEYKGHLGYD